MLNEAKSYIELQYQTARKIRQFEMLCAHAHLASSSQTFKVYPDEKDVLFTTKLLPSVFCTRRDFKCYIAIFVFAFNLCVCQGCQVWPFRGPPKKFGNFLNRLASKFF